jgi:predicted dehydrogenase
LLKLGLIGCGGIGNAHVPGLANLGDAGRVVATADVDIERAESAAKTLRAEKAVADYHELLPDVDAVLLSLPHHLHHPIGMECLAAGKHVLMEKPLANSEQECLDLIEMSERTGLVLMVAYCMRYQPLLVRLKEILDAKTYGEVFQLSIWTEQHTQYPPDHWASSAATLGGGQLFSHGCHYIDLLLWYLGNPVEGTHIGTNYGTPWMEKEGTSNVSIKFESGALGYHFGTWGAKGTRLGYSFHAHCTEGMLEAAITQGKLILHQNREETVLLTAEDAKSLRNETLHFIDCINTGAKPLTDARSSLQGLRVIWKLYEAEQEGVVANLRGLGL